MSNVEEDKRYQKMLALNEHFIKENRGNFTRLAGSFALNSADLQKDFKELKPVVQDQLENLRGVADKAQIADADSRKTLAKDTKNSIKILETLKKLEGADVVAIEQILVSARAQEKLLDKNNILNKATKSAIDSLTDVLGNTLGTAMAVLTSSPLLAFGLKGITDFATSIPGFFKGDDNSDTNQALLEAMTKERDGLADTFEVVGDRFEETMNDFAGAIRSEMEGTDPTEASKKAQDFVAEKLQAAMEEFGEEKVQAWMAEAMSDFVSENQEAINEIATAITGKEIPKDETPVASAGSYLEETITKIYDTLLAMAGTNAGNDLGEEKMAGFLEDSTDIAENSLEELDKIATLLDKSEHRAATMEDLALETQREDDEKHRDLLEALRSGKGKESFSESDNDRSFWDSVLGGISGGLGSMMAGGLGALLLKRLLPVTAVAGMITDWVNGGLEYLKKNPGDFAGAFAAGGSRVGDHMMDFMIGIGEFFGLELDAIKKDNRNKWSSQIGLDLDNWFHGISDSISDWIDTLPGMKFLQDLIGPADEYHLNGAGMEGNGVFKGYNPKGMARQEEQVNIDYPQLIRAASDQQIDEIIRTGEIPIKSGEHGMSSNTAFLTPNQIEKIKEAKNLDLADRAIKNAGLEPVIDQANLWEAPKPPGYIEPEIEEMVVTAKRRQLIKAVASAPSSSPTPVDNQDFPTMHLPTKEARWEALEKTNDMLFNKEKEEKAAATNTGAGPATMINAPNSSSSSSSSNVNVLGPRTDVFNTDQSLNASELSGNYN